MTIDQLAVVFLAIVIGYISRELPRAALWIGCLAGIYLFTGWWWAAGLPQPAGVAAVLDSALVCEILASTHSRKERWQLLAALIVKIMIVINLGYVAIGHLVEIGTAHHWSLELLNYAALLVIGGTAIIEKLGRNDIHIFSITLRDIRAFMRAVLPQGKTVKG